MADGCGGALDCGGCAGSDVCGGAGVANQCAPCEPTACVSDGKNCGTADDGCGGVLDCGDCPSGLSCPDGTPGPVQMWALRTGTTASSTLGHWSSNNYWPFQAGEAPNVGTCGFSGLAWAPATSGTEPEWLMAKYADAVYATGVEVYESYAAPFVYQIELVEPDGTAHVVWEGTDTTSCPGTLQVWFPQTPYLVDRVKIHTQVSGTEQIDAVKLFGMYPYEPNVCQNPPGAGEPPSPVPAAPAGLASSEATVSGTKTGTYVSTRVKDGFSESITEIESGGNPSLRYSYLEHQWTITGVPDTGPYDLVVVARQNGSTDGDSFVISYSIDDVSFTDALTFTTSDTALTERVAADIPLGGATTVYVRVVDSDQTPGNRNLDSITIDYLAIEGPAGEAPPPPPPCVPMGCDEFAIGNTTVETRVGGAITSIEAQQYVMPEDGTIDSISLYHEGGSSGVWTFGVYDATGPSGAPGSLIATTLETPIAEQEGWQTIPLTASVAATGGQTVWLSFSGSATSAPRHRWDYGVANVRYWATWTYPGALPATYPTGAFNSGEASLHANYTSASSWAGGPTCGLRDDGCGDTIDCGTCDGPIDACRSDVGQCCVPRTCETTRVGFASEGDTTWGPETSDRLRAVPYRMPEAGGIRSVSLNHFGGSGELMVGVYADVGGVPGALLGASAPVPIQTGGGWQSVELAAEIPVTANQRVWLAWLSSVPLKLTQYNNNAARYIAGTADTWAGLGGELPADAPAGSQSGLGFLVYADYASPRGVPGATCGALDDGCGGTVYCGSCSDWPQTCGGGGGGLPNACGCEPGGGPSGCATEPEYWARSFGSAGNESNPDSFWKLTGRVDIGSDGSIAWGGTIPSTMSLGDGFVAGDDPTDPFVAKYDSQGNAMWTRAFASTYGAPVHDVLVGPDGDVYATGYITTSWGDGDIALDTTLYATGSWDAYVTRLDGGTGWPQWSRLIGFTGATADVGSALAIDGAGRLIVAGMQDCPGGSGCVGNLLLRQLDSSDGSELWARTEVDGDGEVHAYGVAADVNDDIVVVGFVRSVAGGSTGLPGADLGTGMLTPAGASGSRDTFVARYASDGTILWSTLLDAAGSTWEQANDVAVDPISGRIAVVGELGEFPKSAFVASYDPGGALEWLLTSTGPADAQAYSVGFNAAGNVTVVGVFQDDVSFGSLQAARSGSHTFLLTVDLAGSPVWLARLAGDDAGAWLTSLGAVDPRVESPAVVVAGRFTGNQVLPGYGGSLASAGQQDYFLARVQDPTLCVPDCAGQACGVADGCGGTCGDVCDAGCPVATDCTGLSCGAVNACGASCGDTCDAGCAAQSDCSMFTCGALGSNVCGVACVSDSCDAGCPDVTDCSAFTCGAGGANSCGTACSSDACDPGCPGTDCAGLSCGALNACGGTCGDACDAGCCSMTANGCCPSGCSSADDADCTSCAPKNATCTVDGDCCSNNCKPNGRCA
jgi:hypothetical protein